MQQHQERDVFSNSRYAPVRTAIRSASVTIPVSVVNAQLRTLIENIFELTDARLYFVQRFARAIVPANAKESIDRLQKILVDSNTALETFLAQARTAAAGAGMPDPIAVNTKVYKMAVSTPMSRRFVALFELADLYTGFIDGLWIFDQLTDSERDKSLQLVRRLLHGFRHEAEAEFRLLSRVIYDGRTDQDVHKAKSAATDEAVVESTATAEADPADKGV